MKVSQRSNDIIKTIGSLISKEIQKTVAKDIIKIKKRTELIYVKEEDIMRPGREDIRAKCHYLYWACFRGDV